MNRTYLAALLLLPLLIAGCGGGNSDKKNNTSDSVKQVTITPANTATRTPIPTWTPSSTPQPYVSPTQGPTFTPRAKATETPQPITGAQRIGQNQIVITAMQDDLNTSITNLYQAGSIPALINPPTVTMRYDGWMEIDFIFFDDYSAVNVTVQATARLNVEEGQLTLKENTAMRHVENGFIQDDAVSAVTNLVLQAVNGIVVNLVPAPAGSYQIVSVASFPGYLQVTVQE